LAIKIEAKLRGIKPKEIKNKLPTPEAFSVLANSSKPSKVNAASSSIHSFYLSILAELH
jgi:hypothetical protein